MTLWEKKILKSLKAHTQKAFGVEETLHKNLLSEFFDEIQDLPKFTLWGNGKLKLLKAHDQKHLILKNVFILLYNHCFVNVKSNRLDALRK